MKDVPMMPAQRRLAGHLRLLGIYWLALSAFRLVPGFVLIAVVDSGVFQQEGVPPFVTPLVESIAAVLLILAVAGIVTGWGLLAKQPWARMLAILLGAVSLIDMPFGTALGIYTFWTLLPAESEEQYERMTRTQQA
jgi:hypothetical protein